MFHVFFLPGWWFGTWLLSFHILGIRWTTDFHIFQRGGNHQVAGASGAWRFYSVSASKRLFSTLLAVVGVVVFHQLCQLFQHDQWCTSLEITSPHILETTTSQRWIHLWPHQSLHFSVKIGKNKFLQTQPLSVDLLRASDFRTWYSWCQWAGGKTLCFGDSANANER